MKHSNRRKQINTKAKAKEMMSGIWLLHVHVCKTARERVTEWRRVSEEATLGKQAEKVAPKHSGEDEPELEIGRQPQLGDRSHVDKGTENTSEHRLHCHSLAHENVKIITTHLQPTRVNSSGYYVISYRSNTIEGI